MMKRSATRSPWEVDEFASSSSKGLVEIEAVFEVDSVSNSVSLKGGVDSVSNSVSHAKAEAVEAPSSPHMSTSDFEPVDSRSRSEVKEVEASPASLSGALQ